jgi:hypothetical protein
MAAVENGGAEMDSDTEHAMVRPAYGFGWLITVLGVGQIFVAEAKPHRFTAELARHAIQGCRRVRNPAVLPYLAADALLGYRHNDPLLVNVEADIRDTIPHDPSPMHEARHRPIRRNPRYLHTARRVAPPSGGHVV